MSRDANEDSLDLTTMPLDGVRLIEASAGTGKTFSLAGLYLRLIIERGVAVRDILVVTFTRAAAKELRERIRQRLAAAAHRAGQATPDAPDNPEDQLADNLIARAPDDRDALARRLAEAARRVDEATITTIHGFAQTAARENAFDSGLAFDRGEQVDDRSVHDEVVSDYWRAHAIGREATPGFSDWWPSPDELGKELAPLQTRPHAVLAGPDGAAIERLASQVREAWASDGDAFMAELRACWDEGLLKKGPLYKAIESLGDPDTAFEQLRRRLATDAPIPALPAWTAHLVDPEAEFHKRKKGALARGEALFEQTLAHTLAQLQPLARLAALRDAHAWTRAKAAERKRERRQFSFDDLITAIHDAVTDPDHGERLAASLHATWPWALVDEFQDTDPRQYAIFRRMYAGRETGGLMLIGDPKQSIYGFRGGDVHAYLSAAADAGEKRHSLKQNFRSTPGLLTAVATLFRVPDDNAFLVEGIDYQPVTSGRDDRRGLTVADEPVPPMTLWRMALADRRKPAAEQACRDACVEQIRALLDPEAGGVKQRLSADGERDNKPLAPADIAVLVNTNGQAADIQRALARVGIAAVCLHQASVFASREADDVLHVLKAAATPADEGVLRGALPGPLLGYRLADLLALDSEPGRWQGVVDCFQDAHQRWRHNGVLAALQPLVQNAAERLLTHDDGERRVSNYLQLAELLAGAERENFGITGLLRWLRQAIRDAGAGERTEAEQLRLESDAALVRIATVHKAKGLEYAVVLLPFAPWIGAMGAPDKPPLDFHDDRQQATTDIIGTRANRDAAVREQRAEGLRLLYVALTRAELACYLPWGAANGVQNGALASLLHRADGIQPAFWGNSGNAKPLDDDSVSQRLNALAGEAIESAPLPQPAAGSVRPFQADPPQGAARTPAPQRWQPWAIHSFTRLVHAAAPGPAEAGAADEETPASDAESPGRNLPELPAGAAFGSAVHGVLEAADPGEWPAPGTPLTDDQNWQVARALRQHGIVTSSGRERLIEDTAALVSNTLHTPLPAIGPLTGLPKTSRLPEMAFMLRLRGADLTQLLALLREHGYATGLRGDTGRLLRGLMHGYIDLVVEAGGRYFVLDYKTNWLGNHTDDYGPEALTAAVQHHHYDLQYLIYVTALHRYLRQRLPDYDPAAHLGGVQYLFLRGMGPDAGARGVYHHRPDPALIKSLDELLDDEEQAA